MSKLPEEHRFIDLSDYGRPAARLIVRLLLKTRVSSVQITVVFLIVGLAGAYAAYRGAYILSALLLIAKNILDAADGEMARARRQPMVTGRYLDSLFDFVTNFALFLALFLSTGAPAWLFVTSFLCLEMQGTVFNFYYVVQRSICSGDETSRINEFARADSYAYENARLVEALRLGYLVCYGLFDTIMLKIEGDVIRGAPLPRWFMMLVSSMALGFQLLLIAFFLSLGRPDIILPFFVLYSVCGVLIIMIRKVFV